MNNICLLIVESTFLAHPIKKLAEELDLEQNTAYGMINKQGKMHIGTRI